MQLHPRDRHILALVDRFGQVSGNFLKISAFFDTASATPYYRTMRRLVDAKVLARIEHRLVGGAGGGSGQYVYQLGRKGWALVGREGNYWPYRSVNYHTLAIADVYAALRQAEREGWLNVLDFETEPDCWVTVGVETLKPDLYVDLVQRRSGRRLALWLEIDLGTERPRHIKEKLTRYWWARNNASSDQLPVFPRVVFLAPDAERTKELQRIIDGGKAEARDLFRVVEKFAFPGVLS